MAAMETEVRIRAGDAQLQGTLAMGADGKPLVIFAHGSGSGRNSPRNREVAERLREAGLGTLLFDLLTTAQETVDRVTARLRFDIPMLAERLEAATEWAIARHAGPALARVVSPTLLIVGELDREVHVLNEQALSQLECEKDIAIVPGASHLFEEPGALEEVSAIASAWFSRHLLDEEQAVPAHRPRGERKPGAHRRR